MYFSVVIPTYNRLDMLLRVLDALERQIDAPPFETIVVNDGSKDDT
ncbi:MAG TPA: glycosyltransferase family A protein, partial [Thermoanaerobaculia bacterium]|nr:glycosyltransferase family A protein [Thermoanaerobaculia bacterium]